MEDAALELQKQHVALLRADTGLQALIDQRVFDYVARRTDYPYIVYTIANDEEWDYSDADGEVQSVTIHVFSDEEGSSEARRILRMAHELIQDNTGLSLTDHNLVNCRRVSGDMTREDQIYHAIGLYRAVTEET